ncbi:MAG: dihydroorotase [Ornithinimicrobium sp.]
MSTEASPSGQRDGDGGGSGERAVLITGADLAGRGAGDLLIVGGRIAAVGTSREVARAAPTEVAVVDASGLVALPGLVDLHTHLREPGREDSETIESGSRAAAMGGYTAVFAMANTSPVTDTAEAAEFVYATGQRAGYVDVVPVGAVTKGLAGQELAELGLMARSRANVRVFSDDGKCVHDAQLMRRALEYVKAFDGVVSQHAQDPQLAPGTACAHEGELSGRLGLPGWPDVAEESIVARDVMLARHTGSRVHIAHVSTAGSVEVIRWAKARGIDVTAEVTPHHLMLTTDLLASYDPVFKVNPPLRPSEDVAALQAALADGTIDIVATDHAPHVRADKEHAFADAAFGMLGLEQALSVVSTVMVATGAMNWADVARVMSTTPAMIARLGNQGQGLAEGAQANLTLIDPTAEISVEAANSQSLSRNNPWHGHRLTGAVHLTMLRGRVTARGGHDGRHGDDQAAPQGEAATTHSHAGKDGLR